MRRSQGRGLSRSALLLLLPVLFSAGNQPAYARLLFSTPRIDVGISATSMSMADLNADGRPDVVIVSGQFGTKLAILLGDGEGSFVPPEILPAGAGPLAVDVGDFNRDGRIDLVVASVDPTTQVSELSILAGHGDGDFSPRS